MRSFAAAAALALAMATGASAAMKTVHTIDAWSDPTAKPMPSVSTSVYSYYPNTYGTNCTTVGDCCGAAGQEPCGPLNWVEDNPQCDPANGGQQTPINLDINQVGYVPLNKAAGKIKFYGNKCQGKVVSKKGVWQVEFFDCAQQSKVVVDGETWVLWQMHIHGQSEHTVNGAYYPMETHLVHIPEGESPTSVTRALVLGVFTTVGKSNSVWKVFTTKAASDLGPIFKAINPYSLLPKGPLSYWHYTGSLTTPPCQLGPNPAVNNVQWYVMKKPVPMSAAQLAWTTQYLCDLPLPYLCTNIRPLQEVLGTTQLYSYGKSLN